MSFGGLFEGGTGARLGGEIPFSSPAMAAAGAGGNVSQPHHRSFTSSALSLALVNKPLKYLKPILVFCSLPQFFGFHCLGFGSWAANELREESYGRHWRSCWSFGFNQREG